MTHTSALETALNQTALPFGAGRTLGSEKALREIRQECARVRAIVRFGYPLGDYAPQVRAALEAAAEAVGFASNFELDLGHEIVAHKVQPGVNTIRGVKNIIAVASGKGGVGKSTTSANLALALAQMGAKVGVLDADLYGPSQPMMLGVATQSPQKQNDRLLPVVSKSGIEVMSIGFLVDTDQAVVWRGPMVSQALQQLLFQSEWGDVDYLVVDLPPGTGDIQLTLAQKIPVTGSVVVTTPQDIALIDARKAVDMFAKVNIPIFGVLENMSVHICSQCGHQEPLFGHDGGRELAVKLAVPLLGQLPLSLPIREAMDKGDAEQLFAHEPKVAALYREAAFQVALAIADKGRDFSGRFPKIVVE